MRDTEAIGFIGSMCVRMLGLLVLIAESTVPMDAKPARDYIRSQREWMDRKQQMLALERMVDEVLKENDAE